MNKLDKAAQEALETIYTQFENSDRVTVSSPNYKKTMIDYLVGEGLLEKTDLSTLSGWTYMVRPTYPGELAFAEISNTPLSKVVSFIKRGELIMKEEYHHVTEPGIIMPDYIDGPKSDQWFSEINIFNSRYLKDHPLYDQIASVCKKNKRLQSAHEDMMGFLKALASDDEYWEELDQKETIVRAHSRNANSEERNNKMEFDVFISHANKDKEEYVDELKQSLDKLRIKVFYDKDTIEWGDSWKNRILEGVGKAEFAIIVISKNYFGREWTEKELNELLNRQNTNGQKIILPILHNISIKQLKERYPEIADIQALNSSKYTCDEIALMFAGQLIKRLKSYE